MSETNVTHEQAKAAAERVLGERFCTTCQKHQKLSEGGIWKLSGSPMRPVKRWMCGPCVERRRKK